MGRRPTGRCGPDQPVAVDSVWLPVDLGQHLLAVDLTRTALYDELRERAGLTLSAFVPPA